MSIIKRNFGCVQQIYRNLQKRVRGLGVLQCVITYMCWRNFRDMTVATLFQSLLTSKAFFRLMSFLKSFVPSMRWNFWSLQQDCRAKIREKTSRNHYLSSRKIVEFSFSFVPPPTINGYRSVIIIEVEIWISVRIKKSVIWGLSTFKLKSKYPVIFVDFVVYVRDKYRERRY